MIVTKQDVKMKFMEYGEITVPKGTRLTHNTAMGYDENYHFVDEFSWIKPHIIDGKEVPQFGLIDDAKMRGINIPKEFVEEI